MTGHEFGAALLMNFKKKKNFEIESYIKTCATFILKKNNQKLININ